MNDLDPRAFDLPASGAPVNLSRRGFLGASLGALVLGVSLPVKVSRAQEAAAKVVPGTRFPAFLEINPDGSVLFRSPFMEGGQGVHTAFAQIIGEELDVDPARFTVEAAPPGPDYLVVMGMMRITGGSFSVRSSYQTMRKLGASGRMMLLQAAAQKLDAPLEELTTEPGEVVHAASGRRVPYGEIAAEAAALPIPEEAPLRDASDFRWIGKPVARLDAHDKSTGKAVYGIDLKVEGMLQAAVVHAPRRGQEPGEIANLTEVEAMPGVVSVHALPGAVAVVADRWWRARRAVESLEVSWKEPEADATNVMPADFSSEGFKQQLIETPGPGLVAENHGEAATALEKAPKKLEAVYDAPFLAHGQLEPPSALARWNEDGTLDLWTPNQAPEMYQAAVAAENDLKPEQVRIHSPLLGGFFGRHFLYHGASPYPQAIALAKATGRPVKVIWTREEEFLRDAFRPLAVARFRAGLDAEGLPEAFFAEALGEGPTGRWFGRKPEDPDPSAVEGIADKPYAIAHRRVEHVVVPIPAMIGWWRSVGHSMNDFFYEAFFDEMAAAGGHDPYELRLKLLADKPRHKALLEAVGELSGGWKRGPFTAEDGTRRARGVAMASPFGSEVATIAEVSLKDGEAVVHDVWVAIDPGSIVNPAIIEAQVNSAVALGLSSALLEEVVYTDGEPEARNFDAYPILPPEKMPRVHVRILESGAPMGGVGEPGLPGVPPAVVNAVAVLTGERIRSLPLSKFDLTEGGA
ncbi:xanthine dehydrogenase family protein molybdopterin-binding subunit [Neomegalonema sp.]|uniref:xanthine dehydrogenase family protein molybdopterin-binding subunit n=1 Tax=Neomegalonema sp. TaxID=2039713 RepID=UPI0026342565|nr:xanthine dehydrogenase family protein molybdopterin-binding subunit [Neomegalonema sp.]MDD2867448.1 xanthine dehydrogenase family protein molybdopterin-binding subunit [Neomegalonema sp.]